MSDAELKVITAQIKKLTPRVEALEKTARPHTLTEASIRETAGEGAEKPCDRSRDGPLVNYL
jgi:hypothetical protein